MSPDFASLYTDHIAAMRRLADQALAANGFDHLLIHSGALNYAFLDDNAYPFKVNPHFKRWVPVTDNPECLIIYTPGETPKLAFYSPVDFWHKTHPVPDEYWTAHFEITPVGGIREAKALLPDMKRAAVISETAEPFAEWGAAAINPEGLINHFHFHFAKKTGYELACLREASLIGARAHLAAERAFRDGASEFDIHLAYLRAAEHNEHQVPYSNIIALNEHAAILHYQYQERRPPAEARSFLIDAGASFNGYSSDITRTYARERNDFQHMIERMNEAQLAMCAALRPGMPYADLQIIAHRHVAGILIEFGIARGEADELVANGTTRAFFPHGIGHYLGAQVHDVGGKQADEKGTPIPQPEAHPFLRTLRTVDVDHVFTVEPGLYFIPSLLEQLRATPAGRQVDWQRVEYFRPFGGIRIEDNIRVTADGHENFTRPAFERAAAE